MTRTAIDEDAMEVPTAMREGFDPNDVWMPESIGDALADVRAAAERATWLKAAEMAEAEARKFAVCRAEGLGRGAAVYDALRLFAAALRAKAEG